MGERRYICKQTENIIITHPILQNQKLYQNKCLGDSYWKKGSRSVKKPNKDGWDPTTISTWVILTGLDQEGIPSVLSASMSTLDPKDVNGINPLQTLWTNLMFLLNLSNQNRLNMVLKPSKLEVVTYLDAFFLSKICTSNGISLLLPRFFDKCGICPIFDGLQLVS